MRKGKVRKGEGISRGKETLFAGAIFIILIAALFYKVILNPTGLLYSPASDVWNYSYDIAQLKHEAWRQGVIPIWNPNLLIGASLIGDPESFLFYPFHLIFFLSSPVPWFGVIVMLHLLMAGLFMYLYLRQIGNSKWASLIGGIIFAINAKIIGAVFAGHITFLPVVFAPLVMYLGERLLAEKHLKFGILLGLVLAMQAVGIHAQLLIYLSGFYFAYFAFRLIARFRKERDYFSWNNIFRLGVIGLAALAITAAIVSPYILPILQGSGETTREGKFPYEAAASYSLPQIHLLTLFSPNFFGSPINHTYWGAEVYWELGAYAGIVALLLALLGLRFSKNNSYKWFFALVALFALLFSFGKYFPLFKIFYDFIPGFGLFRAPSRMLFIFMLSVSVLAALGATWLGELRTQLDRRKLNKFSLALLFLVIVLFTASIGTFLLKEKVIRYGQDLVLQRYEQGLLPREGPYSRSLEYYLGNVSTVFRGIFADLTKLAVVSTLFLALLFLWSNKAISNGLMKSGIILLVSFELLSFGIPHIDVLPVEKVYSAPIFENVSSDSPARILDLTNTIKNFQIEDKNLQVITYSANIVPLRYVEVLEILFNGKSDASAISLEELHPGILSMLNVKYVVTSNSNGALAPGFNLINKQNNYQLYEFTEALPRAFLAFKAESREANEILSEMRRPDWDVNDVVYVEIGNERAFEFDGTNAFVGIDIDDKINSKKMNFRNSERAVLVISELYDSGWKAYDNGKRVEVLRVNHILQGMVVEPGEHSVVLRYEPESLGKAFKLSAAALLLSFLLAAVALIYFKER